ncbi:hypothetical protein HPC49_21430 [Pyxidicoccus fallax]|uniref:Uncharacterized protein n=1 Tax=Pyxidicoccus fallax TaxID=394095 RepID=A0A848LIE0_9BACT|nr:hypothetical protein [Pyxidicoccus fallax]NMO17466.1 hypothetical protein [Pyxidicoccus fallax]NPC80775.1 hypothetical protein [Pyxidicoccus fallax]
MRLLRAATWEQQAWADYMLSAPGAADRASVDAMPAALRMLFWKRFRRTARSHAARESAVFALAAMRRPPEDFLPYLWQGLAERRFSMMASLIALSEPELPGEELGAMLRMLREQVPEGERADVALSLLSLKRSPRMHEQLEASGVWEWRALLPPEVGVCLLTVFHPQDPRQA